MNESEADCAVCAYHTIYFYTLIVRRVILCRALRPSVRPSVHPSVRLSVR